MSVSVKYFYSAKSRR